VFNVPDACLALGTAPNHAVTGPSAGPCAGFSVLSAKVDFYDISDSSTILESFSLSTSPLEVNGISIAGSALSGVQTGFWHNFVPTLDIAGGGDYAFTLLLYGGNQAQLIYTNPATLSPGCAFLVPDANCGLSADPAIGTFTTAVPEPETYVLMLAGLVAVGIARRRRR
jgi:hypothetical protein